MATTGVALGASNLLRFHPAGVKARWNTRGQLHSCDGALIEVLRIKNLQFLLLRFVVPNKDNDITMVF